MPGSTPDTAGPVAQERPDELSGMAFDRRAGRFVALTGALTRSGETWTFDVCANTWTRMHPNGQAPPSTGGLVYDVDSDVTIASDSSRIWAYDLEADTWTEMGRVPVEGGDVVLRFFDPFSGLVVALGNSGDVGTPGLALWSYEVETDVWTPIHQANPPVIGPQAESFAFDASVDRLVAYAAPEPSGASTWLFDLRTGTWSATSAATPEFLFGWGPGPAIAYDEAAERTVVSGQGHWAAYDASADSWASTSVTPSADQACGSDPRCRPGYQMVYDPVNERLIAYGGTVERTTCVWGTADDLWAFDLGTGSWTLLVPLTPVAPPLRDLTADGAAPVGPDGSSWIAAKKVTLHGGPFFTRVAGVEDGLDSTPPRAAAASVVDGLFLPECQMWTEGTVWWEQTTTDPASHAWIEIDLGGTFVLDAAVVQADANDEYVLSYRDPKTAAWMPLWGVPFGEMGGLATRPRLGAASVRLPFAAPVVTNALRFEASSGDAQYSVSEVAVFGQPVH